MADLSEWFCKLSDKNASAVLEFITEVAEALEIHRSPACIDGYKGGFERYVTANDRLKGVVNLRFNIAQKLLEFGVFNKITVREVRKNGKSRGTELFVYADIIVVKTFIDKLSDLAEHRPETEKVDSGKKDIKPLEVEKNVTLAWLFNNVPVGLWGKAILISIAVIVSAFYAGVNLSQCNHPTLSMLLGISCNS